MNWRVALKESAIEDLRSLGRSQARFLLTEIVRLLKHDPLADSRNLKTLRPNPVAERELRLFGKYRALFSVDRARRVVSVVLVGEKRGESLIVQGKEFTAHHESDPAE